MNKNFSERLASLKKAFGIKDIVEDSILSDFKNKDPKSVVDADSKESVNEIEKAKEDIPEVDKSEGIDSMKNFAESTEVTKKVTKEDIENAENEAVLAEMKARKALAEKSIRDAESEVVNFAMDESFINKYLKPYGFNDPYIVTKDIYDLEELFDDESTTIEEGLQKVGKDNVYVGRILGFDAIGVEPFLGELDYFINASDYSEFEKALNKFRTKGMKNFAEEKKDESKNDDKVYDEFIKSLLASKKPESFKGYLNAAQDPGFCNRFVEDKETIKKLESGEGIKDESKKSEIIKLRKEFIDAVKKTRKGYEDTVKNSEDNAKNSYIAGSKTKDDFGKLEIAIKRMLLSADSESINKALKVISENPAIYKVLSEDDEFWTELSKLKDIEITDSKKSNFAEEKKDKSDGSQDSDSEDKPKTWFKFDDVKGTKLPDLRKKLEDLSSKMDKFDDAAKSNKESLKKIEGDLADLIKAEEMKDGKRSGGWFKAPDEAKKDLESAIKDSKDMLTTKTLGMNIRAAVAAKVQKKKKDGDELSKDEQDIVGDKMIMQSIKERERSNKLGLAKGMIAGMDQPGADFLNSIFDFLAKKGQNDDAKKLVAESGKESASNINTEASFELEDEDESEVELSEDDKKSLDEFVNKELPKELIPSEEDEEVSKDEEKEITGSITNFPKKPTKEDYPDEEQYKIALDMYNDTLKTIKKSGLLKNKAELKKIKIKDGLDFKTSIKEAYSGIKTVASDLKDGAKDITKSIGELSKDLGDAFSNSADGIKASGEAVKSALEGIGEAGKDLLEGGSSVTESIGEAIKKAGDTDMTPDQIAAEAEKICKEKDAKVAAKIDWAKAKEAIRDEKFMNKLKESVESAKAKAEKKSIKWSSKLDKLTAEGLMDIAEAENKGELKVAKLDAKKNIKEAEAALDIAKKEIKANKEMTDNELESEIEKQLIEQKKDKNIAKLMAKAAVKMCKQDTKSDVKVNAIDNKDKVSEAKSKKKSKTTSDQSDSDETAEAIEESKDSSMDSESEVESVAFTEYDPMESIINGEVPISSTKNFGVNTEFEDFESNLHKLWDFN